MKVALGRLGWPPNVFWSSTPHEFWAAFDDWVEVNCVNGIDHSFTEEEVARIESMKRRFPDRPRSSRSSADRASLRRQAPHARS